MSFKLKYIKYKKKYNELKGGILDKPGETYITEMNIRHLYNDLDISNNIDRDEYEILTKLDEKKYFESIYNLSIDENMINKILNKINLYYKKLYLRGVGIENYPYGIYELKNYISLSNDFIFLFSKGIIKRDLQLYTFTHGDKKFIEVIRFEKDVNDNWVLQNIKSEKIADPGYMLKGIFYYPCIGSGIFLHYNNIKYFYNKLDAISKMHEEWSIKNTSTSLLYPSPNLSSDRDYSSEQSREPFSFSFLFRSQSDYAYTDPKAAKRLKKENQFKLIKKEDIIKNFIRENNFGRFDPSKNIHLSNLDYICNKIKKFSYLNNIGYLEYLFKNFCQNNLCDEKIKDKIYELYYVIFSCELTFPKLLEYIEFFDDKSNILNVLTKLATLATSDNDNKLSIKELLIDKEILNNFINRHQYLNTLIKNIKDDSDYILETNDAKKLINNIMIEIYTQIYTSNFNQLFIDSTLFYYARKLDIDTIVLLCEPSDKNQHIGTEVISIEDYQFDSFNRTINCAKLQNKNDSSFSGSLLCYLMNIAEEND